LISKPKSNFTEKSLVKASKLNYGRKNYKEALGNYIQLETMAENNENVLNALVGKFRCYYYLKDYTEAINAGVPLIAIKKLPEETIREIHYDLAKSYYANNQLDAALNEFKIIAKDTKNEAGAESKFTISEIYYTKNKLDLAEQEVFDFIKVNTPHQFWLAKSFLILSDIYVVKKDNFQAKQTLQSLIENYESKDDGIIDTAKSRLDRIIKKEEMLKQIAKDSTNITINFDDKSNKNYNSLFDNNPANTDTLNKIQDIKINETIDSLKIKNNIIPADTTRSNIKRE
jgi:hypothetical protein